MILDMHTHSCFSYDVEQNDDTQIMTLLRKARKSGIDIVAVTDHCDLDLIKSKEVVFDFDGYRSEIQKGRQAYIDTPDEFSQVIHGIELGQLNQFQELGKSITEKESFDFILGSIHNLRGMQDFYLWQFDCMSSKELERVYNCYLDELCELAEKCDFDSLAHITYPLRYYIISNKTKAVDFGLFESKLKELFDLLIKREKAIEINTSGLRQGVGSTLPPVSLLTLYRSMGGRLVTVGSDAHSYADIGKGICDTYKELSAIGFDGVCVYKNRICEIVPFDIS